MQKGFLLAENILQDLLIQRQFCIYQEEVPQKSYISDSQQLNKLLPEQLGLVDERYGEKFHEKSNETMIRETGFFRYLQMRDIPFYSDFTREKTRSNCPSL